MQTNTGGEEKAHGVTDKSSECKNPSYIKQQFCQEVVYDVYRKTGNSDYL